MSKSFEGRKLLTNTLLVSKGNYQLPMMFGLREGDFRVMQKGIDGFIFKKKIYKGEGKYCSKKKGGGLGSVKIYER